MKVVFKVDDVSEPGKLLSIVSNFAGVQSMAVDDEKGTLTVVGEVDAVEVASALRKAKFMAQVISFEARYGDKKAEVMKPEPPGKMLPYRVPVVGYEEKKPEELDRTDGEIAKEVELLPPISASLGAIVSLSGKLDALLDDQHKNEIGELTTRLLKLSKAWDPPVTARIWMKDVRELSYDMENCVDAQTDWIHKLPGFLARVKEANGRYDRYMLNSVATDDRQLQTVDGWREQQHPNVVVGLHVHNGPFERLCHLLTDGDEQLKVLSVLGAGGIGKTTLAKQIWREHKLRDYFHCGAFVRTAKKPDMRRILRSILAQVRPHRPPDASEVHELIHDIRGHLQDKRYFLIIDDLWATSVWDVATRAFPEGTHGSRIITTTEIEDVALACCSYQSRYIFKMEPLSDSHSKELFTSVVFGSVKKKYRQIDEVSDEIIRRCEGLPQAIVSIFSVLASQEEANAVENWEQIQNSLPTNATSEEKLKQVLNFCYRCLPSCLQTCLLYLSFYPENYILLKEDIMKQWVAEGFICAPTAKAKMEVAGSYFDKLVNMGLIQHIDVDYSNEVLYYAVHHIVHDVITSKSMEENFITVLDYSKRTTRFSNKVSRLSLQFGSATYATPPASTGLSQVRSLAFIGLMSCFPSILEFKLLRFLVLHIWGDQPSTGFNLGIICELLLLRYLQVTCNDTIHLPDQMQGLKHLETFETNARIAAIPSDIFHLQSLLHLRLGGGTELPDLTGIVKNATLNPPPSASRRAISLDYSSGPPDLVQTIELLPPICRMPKWIGQLSNLCSLKIVVRELQRNDISNLQGLPGLTVLSLYVQRRTSTEPISFVTGAFAALEYFEFRCGVLCLAFEEGAMPSLQRIKLGFNAHSGEQYGCLFVGIEDMLSVQKISVLIGSAVGAEERDMKAAMSAVKKAMGKHHSNVSIERADMVDEEFDPPELHHLIRGKQPSTSSAQPGSGKQEAQENIKQKADTNSQLIKRYCHSADAVMDPRSPAPFSPPGFAVPLAVKKRQTAAGYGSSNPWAVPPPVPTNAPNGLGGGTGIFSTSLPVLPHEKLISPDSAHGTTSIDDTAAKLKDFDDDPQGNDDYKFDFDLRQIDDLLPDEDDLFAGITNEIEPSAAQANNPASEELEEFDVFGSGGGMELDSDPLDSITAGLGTTSIGDGLRGTNGVNNFGLSNSPGAVAGEHPFGEHPSRTLFVRNINSNVEDSELRSLFEQFGDIRTLYTATKHRGFVMISYFDIRAARGAMRSLQNKPLRRRKLDIHFSIPKENPSDKDLNQGTLVIFNLDPSVSNEEVRQMFGAYGEVKEIRETPNKKHHKFIEFYDVRAAEAALRSLNKSEIAGKRIKLEPSRPGGTRRSLVQQLGHELEQDEPRGYRNPHVGSPMANSPPGVWAQYGSPTDNSLSDNNSTNFRPILSSPRLSQPFFGNPTYQGPGYFGLDSSMERGRNRRVDSSVFQADNKKQYQLDLEKIRKGEDTRTTLMIKNIPNKYTSKMLLAAIDELHKGTYDFFYLPIDFKNKCNVGHAFINMISPVHIISFYQAFNGKKWEKFNSEKVASLAYGRIQGRNALISRFQNSSLMNEDKRCRPILFHSNGPETGNQEPFPNGICTHMPLDGGAVDSREPLGYEEDDNLNDKTAGESSMAGSL